MKKCNKCGHMGANDSARFCPECGSEYAAVAVKRTEAADGRESEAMPIMGDKNLVNNSTIVGRQEKFEASNITIHNNITEDHSHVTVVCAVSGKRIYMDQSVVCPQCGRQVAKEYYVETSKRCENCEQEAREQFGEYARRITAEGPFDTARRQQMDNEARRLHIDSRTAEEILRTLQKNSRQSDNAVLTPLQQSELKSAVEVLVRSHGADTELLEHALASLRVLHEAGQNYLVDCWYYLAMALARNEEYVQMCENEITDIYWMRYWSFAAYQRAGSPKAGMAVDRLATIFADREDDVKLAETVYYMSKGFRMFDMEFIDSAREMLSAVRRDYLSQPLTMVYDTTARIISEGLNLDMEFSDRELFVMYNILGAGGYISLLHDNHQKEMQAAAAAEEARRRKEAAANADRMRRTEEEKARQRGEKPANTDDTKAFAGYSTPIPVKKSGWKKKVLIVVVCIIVILIALFLIPAPESMQ